MTQNSVKAMEKTGHAISRKSVAAFMATVIQNPKNHINENL